jgi:hypothetical protein
MRGDKGKPRAASNTPESLALQTADSANSVGESPDLVHPGGRAMTMTKIARVLLLLAACGGSNDHPKPDAAMQFSRCAALEGTNFASVAEHECGLGPNGPVMCTWHIAFSARSASESNFDWSHSDVGETGVAICDGNDVFDVKTLTHRGLYDAATKHLVWDSLDYAAP